MFLSESLVLFLQFVFCITYVLEIRYAYTKDKQNEFTSYNIIIPVGTPKHWTKASSGFKIFKYTTLLS